MENKLTLAYDGSLKNYISSSLGQVLFVKNYLCTCEFNITDIHQDDVFKNHMIYFEYFTLTYLAHPLSQTNMKMGTTWFFFRGMEERYTVGLTSFLKRFQCPSGHLCEFLPLNRGTQLSRARKHLPFLCLCLWALLSALQMALADTIALGYHCGFLCLYLRP